MLAVEGVEEARAVDRGRGLRGGELQERRVGVGELARRERADVQDAEDGALDEQRHAEQRADALHPQDRVQDVGVVDVGDEDRPASGRDASREAPAERDAHAALDLLLETLGGACDELAGVVVEQQDGDGVDTEDVLRAGQQLVEQGLQGQLGQRGIRQPVDVLELARRPSMAGSSPTPRNTWPSPGVARGDWGSRKSRNPLYVARHRRAKREGAVKPAAAVGACTTLRAWSASSCTSISCRASTTARPTWRPRSSSPAPRCATGRAGHLHAPRGVRGDRRDPRAGARAARRPGRGAHRARGPHRRRALVGRRARPQRRRARDRRPRPARPALAAARGAAAGDRRARRPAGQRA